LYQRPEELCAAYVLRMTANLRKPPKNKTSLLVTRNGSSRELRVEKTRSSSKTTIRWH